MAHKFSVLHGVKPWQSTCQIVRAHFGLSQADLASYLGISRPLLSLVELKRRDLSLDALTRLLPLAQHPQTPEPAAAPPTGAIAVAVRAALLDRQASCTLEARRLQQELQPHLTRLAQARRRLHVLPALRAALPAPLSTRQERWLAWFEEDAHVILQGPAAAAAALLELRIGALHFEAEQAGQQAAALPAPNPA